MLHRTIAGIGPLVVIMACQPPAPQDDATEVELLISEEMAAFNLPFSEAVRVGDMIYLSGNIGVLPGTTELAPGGLQAEARQTMENIRTVLERYGSSMDRVVKCTVMIDDMNRWNEFNEVYVTFFPNDKPARSSFGADGLALGAAVEVECWARVGPAPEGHAN